MLDAKNTQSNVTLLWRVKLSNKFTILNPE
jgi:hypothetical protein